MIVKYGVEEVTPEQVQQRAQQIAERAARAELATEQARQAEARAQSEAQLAARRRAAEDRTVERLRAMAAGYEERLRIAEELIEPLCRFYKLEKRLQREERDVLNVVAYRDLRLAISLRRRAGLADTHDVIGVFPDADCRIVRAVLIGIIQNAIVPDGERREF